ncbi:NAD-dependent epimerase/dehydratase family protein [Roseivirga thermotolerans]|uniref:N-acetyl-alpha-D-glucosaminyl-diphospho-ditrans, octacis-undecaprenol 4-epimerase n=1 Tax=Roseivirga thermotolerans TaxID=1758176 RepID=A0ABQ3I1L3_9BACT|nr:NAD-dependent epimerase/dehydratase family protein [Roseivirga thermotolerans]GHE53414.1 N-acetyl-alpha-D-glucosaminyl-diphospho-ditrans, octacis-undecaprenol 4-epimerase [Roseivirga thermotolerans]
MSKTLILGGSGFVGSYLIKELGVNSLQNFDKNPSPFFNKHTIIGDIRNVEDLASLDSDFDTVVLLAAEHRDDVSPVSVYYDVNVQGTKNVLDFMDKCGIKRLIFTSSVAVYGLNKDNPAEDHPEDPFNHYGKSKWRAEQVIKKWYDDNPEGKSVTIIRPTVIFGERNRGNVYNLLKQIASGRFLMIGSGQNKKSMAYVGNVVSFIKQCLDTKASGYNVYNYVDKPDLNMTELVSLIEAKLNIDIPKQRIPYALGMLGGYFFDLMAFISSKKLSINSVRVKKFCATTQFDSSKVHSVFRAPFSLKQGLERTLEYEFTKQKDDEILFFSE